MTSYWWFLGIPHGVVGQVLFGMMVIYSSLYSGLRRREQLGLWILRTAAAAAATVGRPAAVGRRPTTMGSVERQRSQLATAAATKLSGISAARVR